MADRLNVRLRCSFALGDIVVLSGALRELHEQYPGRFLTDVETSCPEVWLYNPYITRFGRADREIDCNRVGIDKTGSKGIHYLEAYLELFNSELGTRAKARRLAGDIYLSGQEKDWYSDIWRFCGEEVPFWIIGAGGKFDIPIKWWDPARLQEIVDHFAGRILFAQVGSWSNHHPRLKNTIDLRGKTGVRDLIHLMYHARGVICGVTSLMHLAAAVPSESGGKRHALIFAGAREARVWEAYPGHHYFDTSSQVPCAHCWKQRFFPLPDRGLNHSPKIMCGNLRNELPRCMDRITARELINTLELLLERGEVESLNEARAQTARKAVAISEKENDFDRHNITPLNALAKADEFIRGIPPYPRRRFSGRGIILCGGGVTYFTNAWVCVQVLRSHGCGLPIELWHLGRHELDRRMESLLRPLGVRCVNAREVMNRHPFRNPLGWELKSYALLHSPFKEVLLLDSDNVALRNPEFLFETAPFRKTGAVFWPDFGRLGKRRAIWRLCGVPYRDEPEFESGQMVIDKEKCWRAVNLAFWYNDHSEFFYQHVHGDKETFHMAWRKLDQPYAMPDFPIFPLEGTMCQHDFEGNRLFQHRNLRKWRFFAENEPVAGFELEDRCLEWIESLRALWDGRIHGRREIVVKNGIRLRKESRDEDIFKSVRERNEYRLPNALAAHDVVIDIGAHIGSFALACHERGSRQIHCFEAHPENARLARENLRSRAGVKVIEAAVLDRKARFRPGPFPRTNTGEDTGSSPVILNGGGSAESLRLDDILRKFERVKILKLACEGSEWEILRGSREWRRVEMLCGEFHLSSGNDLGDIIPSRALLRRLLQAHFQRVKTMLDRKNPGLGKFWAFNPKDRQSNEGGVIQFPADDGRDARDASREPSAPRRGP